MSEEETNNIKMFKIFGALSGIIILALWVFPWLWNSTVTELFNLPPIDAWMGIKIMIISTILFKAGKSVK